jgi:hypothetical protein
MATISVANFKTLADSIARQAEILKAAVGTEGSDTGTCAEGAQNNIDRIVGFTDADQIAALLTSAQAALSRIASTNALRRLLPELLRALDNHVGGINEWGATNDVRVHYLLGEVDVRDADCEPLRRLPPLHARIRRALRRRLRAVEERTRWRRRGRRAGTGGVDLDDKDDDTEPRQMAGLLRAAEPERQHTYSIFV